MKKISWLLVFFFLVSFSRNTETKKEKWVSLFDGKTFEGWKVGNHANSFTIEGGAIMVNGEVGHLYYTGPAEQHNFKNFELKIDVMTTPGSNSGIYFHTQYQEKGWPAKGYEVQVNNSHTDWRRTAGLWGIKDTSATWVKDNEWFTVRIKVKGMRIRTYINDKLIIDYTEPENASLEKDRPKERLISSGTFALQAHDPKSKVFYKNIWVKTIKE
jgi:hypothetical protein